MGPINTITRSSIHFGAHRITPPYFPSLNSAQSGYCNDVLLIVVFQTTKGDVLHIITTIRGVNFNWSLIELRENLNIITCLKLKILAGHIN